MFGCFSSNRETDWHQWLRHFFRCRVVRWRGGACSLVLWIGFPLATRHAPWCTLPAITFALSRAWLVSAERQVTREVAMAKMAATENAPMVVSQAVQADAGCAWAKSSSAPIATYALRIYGGATGVQKVDRRPRTAQGAREVGAEDRAAEMRDIRDAARVYRLEPVGFDPKNGIGP